MFHETSGFFGNNYSIIKEDFELIRHKLPGDNFFDKIYFTKKIGYNKNLEQINLNWDFVLINASAHKILKCVNFSFST